MLKGKTTKYRVKMMKPKKAAATISLLLLFSLLSLLVMPVNAEEMVNGGFEDDWTGWTNSGCDISTSEYYSGAKSAHMEYSCNFYQDLSISIDDIWSFEVYAKKEAGSGNTYIQITHDGGTDNIYNLGYTTDAYDWQGIDLKDAMDEEGCYGTLSRITVVRMSDTFRDFWLDGFTLVITEPPVIDGDDILYFRTDTWNVSSEVGYKLMQENTFSNSSASITPYDDAEIGIRVWKYDVFEEATEITEGEPDALVYLDEDEYGEQIGYLNSGDHFDIIDHLKIIVYMRSGEDEWVAKAQFVSGSGDSDIQYYRVIKNSTWAVHYWLNFTNNDDFTFQWGNKNSCNSYIQCDAPKADPWRVSMARLSRQDLYGTITAPWAWIFGANVFWTIIYLGCITFLYIKHGSYKMVLLITWILGGSGSILWAVVPASGLVAAAVMLALAMAGTLFKIFHR